MTSDTNAFDQATPTTGHAGAARPTDTDRCCSDCSTAKASSETQPGDPTWLRAAQYARWLAWASLFWMTAEGVLGLAAGIAAGSIALIGWALGSAIEGLASIIVVWRFTGARTLSETSERRAQKTVAISFWLIAPYIVIEATRDLITSHQPDATLLGIILTGSSVIVMPGLGIAKQRLGTRLSSNATASEGTQNLMCAAQAGAVLIGLLITAVWSAGTWVDPVIALVIAGWAVWEGLEAWRGEDCC
ncbi:MAG TPA: cation transporter [Gemmatimonadales bacterium]|nr:cation transporter [Gemmatimonadales bacterium]